MMMDHTVQVLNNVRLETGFETENGIVTGTRTGLFSIEMENGLFRSVKEQVPAKEGIDAKGLLMLPAFRDMHTHLDKSLYGLPWKAVSAGNRTVKDMIAMEQQMIPGLLETSVQRSAQLIELLQSHGISYARSHFNIEPTSGLRSLENLLRVLEQKKDSFAAELVAFPQHGLFYTDTVPLMREAAALDTVQYIGGLDPYSIDGSVEKPLDFTIQLALDHGKGIDIHLHETGASGVQTIDYLIEKVLENPALRGKTCISHAYVLAVLPVQEVERLAERLAAAEISIATALPYGAATMPLPLLWQHGVSVLSGNDNIQDHWSTLGSGSLLYKANLAAGLYGRETEWELSRLLKMATNGILPLDDEGRMQWPKAGAPARFVWTEASCSAEAVARMSPVRSLVHDGHLVF
ncbi:MAG: amidohydrolase family protein [Chitinophagaceae bacterium]|nr:amidohydrolase family protein [Chitinophagaceae bacterium]